LKHSETKWGTLKW